jgi:hypothetical protein
MPMTSCGPCSARCANDGSAGRARRWSPPMAYGVRWHAGAPVARPGHRSPRHRSPYHRPDQSARPAAARPHGRRPGHCRPAAGHRRLQPGRLRGNAALAALCGASPVEASPGNTSGHRLNRGGDRAANNALWVIAHAHDLRPADPRLRRQAHATGKAARRSCVCSSVTLPASYTAHHPRPPNCGRRMLDIGASVQPVRSRVAPPALSLPCRSAT